MPKFEFESEFRLKETLSAMGMPVAFCESADFSGMTDNRDFFIGDVVHKALLFWEIEEGWHKGNPTVIDEIYVTDFVNHSPFLTF